MSETKSKRYVKVFVTKTDCFQVEVTEMGEHFPEAKTRELYHRRYQVSVGSESWCGGKGLEHYLEIKGKVKRLLFKLIGEYVREFADVDEETRRVEFDFNSMTICYRRS